MENKLLVSIIMNCYNSQTYLKEAIESVLAQTYEHFELIFWDNQSTDESALIVQNYDDERIRYFYAPCHTSLGEGRNLALQKVRGEYISFLDCDDIYLPTKLEKTLEVFRQGYDLVYTNGYTLFQESGEKKPFYTQQQPSGDMFERWISSYTVMIPSVMFSKKVLDSLPYWFDNRFSMIEEFDFFLRIAKEHKVGYVDEKLCIWRAHSGSLTWSKKELFEQENRLFLENILRLYPELVQTKALQHFRAKIAYQAFYNQWYQKGQPNRKLLQPYFFIDKRFLIIYFLSFFGWDTFQRVLKFIGKSI